MDWDKISEELQKPLDPSAIKPPAPGKYGEYVDGYHIITEANRIFGHGGWSYEVTRLDQTSGQVFELKGNGGEPYQQYRCSFLCTVRAVIGGVTREGAAVGTGSGKPENMGDVIESAVKEAETDALKRALRSFGNTFGLALYERDKDRRQVGNPLEVEVALAAIDKAANGRELLSVLSGLHGLHNLAPIRGARVERLRAIVKGAQSIEALAALEKNFAPDWPAVRSDAEMRAREINGGRNETA